MALSYLTALKALAFLFKIARAALERVAHFLIHSVLIQSHQCHVALRRWQRRWHRLVPDVNTMLVTASSLSADDYAVSFLLIANVGSTTIDELELCVEAQGAVTYQRTIRLHRLKPGSTFREELIGFPQEDLIIVKDTDTQYVASTYDAIEVFPIFAIRDGFKEVFSRHALPHHPTYTDFLNGRWAFWRGKRYNVDVIERAIEDAKWRIAHRLCGWGGLCGVDVGSLLCQARENRRFWRLLPAIALYALVARRIALVALIWAPLVLRLKKLEFEIDDDMQRATGHVIGRAATPIGRFPLPEKSLS